MVAKKKTTKVSKKSAKNNDIDVRIKVKDAKKLAKCDCKDCSCSGNCGGFYIFGAALAMILSYAKSSSIMWAIFHGILSWFYVLFRAIQIWFGWF